MLTWKNAGTFQVIFSVDLVKQSQQPAPTITYGTMFSIFNVVILLKVIYSIHTMIMNICIMQFETERKLLST
jgi:hypothetical protein